MKASKAQIRAEKLNWNIIEDSPGKLEMLPVKDILVNRIYQRDEKPSVVAELAKKWSWIACGAITIAKRDGKYYAMDGQHRVSGAKKRGDIETIPCIVFETQSIKQEAAGYEGSNTNRNQVSSLEKYRSALAREEEDCVFLQSLFNKYSLIPSNGGTRNQSVNSFCAIGLARKMLKATKNGKENLETALRVTVDLCQGKYPAIERIFSGLDYINRYCIGYSLNSPKLYKRIMQIGYTNLNDGAIRASTFYMKGGERVWAIGMIEALNKGLHTNFVLKQAQ